MPSFADLLNLLLYLSLQDMPSRRYLLCPAGLSVLQLKKFIYNKFEITPQTYKVDIIYAGRQLSDEYTLMDVAYIFSWGRVSRTCLTCVKTS